MRLFSPSSSHITHRQMVRRNAAFALPFCLPRPVSLQTPRCTIKPPSSDSPLHWKDRVALYAQLSPAQTLHTLLSALQSNPPSGPLQDDGIDALYSFANLDIWALTHTFFGRRQDLGQFERFKRVLVARPYDVLLGGYDMRILSAVRIGDGRYVTRRRFVRRGMGGVFRFDMSLAEGGAGKVWMVDCIVCEKVLSVEKEKEVEQGSER